MNRGRRARGRREKYQDDGNGGALFDWQGPSVQHVACNGARRVNRHRLATGRGVGDGERRGVHQNFHHGAEGQIYMANDTWAMIGALNDSPARERSTLSENASAGMCPAGHPTALNIAAPDKTASAS